MRKTVLTLFVVFVAGRLGYLGYQKHAKPWLAGVFGWAPAELSPAGHELAASLQRQGEWALSPDGSSLTHLPDRRLRVDFSWADRVAVALDGAELTCFTESDLNEFRRLALALRKGLRDSRVDGEREGLRSVLKTKLPGQ